MKGSAISKTNKLYRWWTASLKTRLVLIVLTFTLILSSLIVGYWRETSQSLFSELIQRMTQSHLDTMAETLTPYLLQNQLATIYEMMNNLLQANSEWLAAVVRDGEGLQIFPLTEVSASAIESGVELNKDVIFHGERIGTISLYVDTDKQLEAFNTAHEVIQTALLLIMAMMLTVLLFAVEFMIRRPMGKLVYAFRRLAAGHFNAPLPSVGSEELKQLIQSFDLMRTQIELKRKLLDKTIVHTEEANRAKSRFLANVSHEVRTPLNGILALVRVLAEQSNLDGKPLSYAKIAYQSAQHLLMIVNQILDVSKLEQHEIELAREEVDLARIAMELRDLVILQISEKGLVFNCEIDENLPIMIGDVTRIRQIMMNLIYNAIKFTAEGSISLGITCVEKNNVETTFRVDVIDTGPGFSEEQTQSLFQPFIQASDNVLSSSGTGLGLAICKQLVEAMGGEMLAKSKLGEGATFSFTLTLKNCATMSEKSLGVEGREETQSVSMLTENSSDSSTSSDIKPIDVLVVDDSPANLIVIEAYLDGTRYRVHKAMDGQQALAAIKEQAFDIVLMDHRMPVMDGITATEHIRSEMPEKSSMPIIALTASAMDGDQQLFLDSGMDDYISKPVDKECLIERLEYWLKKINS